MSAAAAPGGRATAPAAAAALVCPYILSLVWRLVHG